MKTNKNKIFLFALFIAATSVLIASAIKVYNFNKQLYSNSITIENIDEPVTMDGEVSMVIDSNGGTWDTIFDTKNEGITENNYRAYIYNFNLYNNTDDTVSDFTFKLKFGKEAYIAAAWNGSVEVHQFVKKQEKIELIPDLRDYNDEDYDLEFFHSQSEKFIKMTGGDYIIYYPDTKIALETPLKAGEQVGVGFIIYAPIGDKIENSTVELKYVLHRDFAQEPLFWAGIILLVIWVGMFIGYFIALGQIKKYQEQHKRDNEFIKNSIETFTSFIDAKDPYTEGHSRRVAEYSQMIARKMNFDEEELDKIYYIALLHDCGKIAIPDSVLKKPDKLTDDEFETIKSHTTRGKEMLKNFKNLQDVGAGAMYHHERYDGKGYPEGLSGEDIPLVARIICVADSFDAMNSNRVYRKKLSAEYIVSEIEKNKGSQFDPKIADIMLELIKTNKVKVD